MRKLIYKLYDNKKISMSTAMCLLQELDKMKRR